MIEERKKNVREEMQQQKIASHSIPYKTRLLAAMDLEINKTKLPLHHPIAKSLPSGSQLNFVDISLDMTNIPSKEKINQNRQAGEMLYNELRKSALIVSKANKLLEKAAIRVKQEKANSISIHLLNEDYKEFTI